MAALEPYQPLSIQPGERLLSANSGQLGWLLLVDIGWV